MTTPPLPAVPDPYADELMTSWIERIGLFYGADYPDTMAILNAHGPQVVRTPDMDFDSDDETRRLLCSWTGRCADQVPAILDPLDRSAMHPPARVTYCGLCWDEDCAAGRQPYIRARWVRWSAVHCPRHEVWLSARRPRLNEQSPLHAWNHVWRSQHRWAEAFGSRYEGSLAIGANAFSPDLFATPSGPWTEFDDDVRGALGGKNCDREDPFAEGSLTSIIRSTEFTQLRRDVAAAMQAAPSLIRLDDRDIICYPWPRPVWIAERIVCLVIAVECLRFFDGRPALFAGVAPLVHAAQRLSILGRR